MKPVRMACAVLFSLLAGCPGPSTDTDAGVDAGAGIDASRSDGGADATASDGAMRDVGIDAATLDAGRDAATLDAGIDAAMIDAAMTDVGRDAATIDAGRDAAATVDADLDGGPEPHPVVEEFLGSLATEVCAFYERCGLDLSFALSFFDVGSCEELVGFAYADQTAPGYRALIAAGTASYDSVLAQSCLDTFPTLACDDAMGTMVSCVAVFHGLLADGASCSADAECHESSYCDDAYGCGNVGVCRPRAALGASCSGGVGCVVNTYCGAGSVCTAYADVGGTCGPTIQCGFGLECWSAVCGDPSTRTPAGVGGACALEVGMRCASTLVCTSDTHTCQPGGVALGSACHPATPDPCAASAYCGAGDVCRMRAAVGASCAGGVACVANSRCSGSVCVAISRIGGACSDASYCRSDVCTAMVCAPGRFCD